MAQIRNTGVAVAAFLAASTAIMPTSFAAGVYTQIYLFTGGADGAIPFSGVTFDAAGNMYGETAAGGNLCKDAANLSGNQGCGTVYKVSPTGQFTTLVTFTGANGAQGLTQMVLVGSTLYGSTAAGGSSNMGVVFSVNTDGSNFQVLHQFAGRDGSFPFGNLVADAGGAIYGVTQTGGITKRSPAGAGNGVLFQLNKHGAFDILHAFNGRDGSTPVKILIGPTGTIYGAAEQGGLGCNSSVGCGTIFSYSQASRLFTTIYYFSGGQDGGYPSLGSVSADGTIFGATAIDGAHRNGTMFQLAPSGTGYTLTTLHQFTNGVDGGEPHTGPTLLPDGTLVGTSGMTLYFYDPAVAYDGVPLQIMAGNPDYSQPIIGPGNLLFGTTNSTGGTATCLTSAGVPIYIYSGGAGCGYIYSYQRGPLK